MSATLAAEAHAALVKRLKDYVARGLDPTDEIRRNRDFHNPMLLEKIVRYFDIDDDGKVVLLQLEVPDAERTRVEEAARSCPVSALSVEG